MAHEELPTGITEALIGWESAPKALERRLPAVYSSLRRIAQGYLSNEDFDHTLEPTELLDNALRFVDQGDLAWKSREHFFAETAKMMEKLIEDHLYDRHGSSSNFRHVIVTASKTTALFPKDESVTEILGDWQGRSQSTRDRLMPLVFDDLRRMARRQMQSERSDHTLQPTALVNELYLRLLSLDKIDWESRSQFFAVAAKLMRQTLVDYARKSLSRKRGLDGSKVSLDEIANSSSITDPDLLALDEALAELAELDSRMSRVVELRFFAGLNVKEIAEVLSVSRATVKRDWHAAKAWLFHKLKDRGSTAIEAPNQENEASAQKDFLSRPVLKEGVKIIEQSEMREGRIVGSYKIIKEIGRGGMGTVYLARRDDGVTDQKVAVKILPKFLETGELRQRFVQEGQILAAVDHPSVVRFLDGGEDEEVSYLVMEYVAGQPINVWCDERRLSIRQRLYLFVKVADAVSHAHQQRVVHRDLKPSNVLVTSDGVPKLLDFGIAEHLESTADNKDRKLKPMTLEYASPEQIRGEVIAVRDDIYTLGVLLYELLTGERPHRLNPRTHSEALRVIGQEEPVAPSQAIGRQKDAAEIASARRTNISNLRQILTGYLDTILLKALAKKREERYKTVEEFSEAVLRHLDL